MNDLHDKLFKLLEKTSVHVKMDRTARIDYWAPNDFTEPEKKPFCYSMRIDNYTSYEKYYEELENLFKEVKEQIGGKIENSIFYKENWIFLKRLKAEIFPLYENFDLNELPNIVNSFQSQMKFVQDISYFDSLEKLLFEPGIEVIFKNGNYFEVDIEKIFKRINKHVIKKISLIKRLIPLVDNYLEIINSKSKSLKNKSFQFIESKYLGNSRLQALQDDLFDFGFIDKRIDIRLFKNCFSGKVVDEKINWTEDKIYLIYFVNQLVARKFIKPKEKWIALANSFLFRSETIIPSTFYYFSETTNTKVKLNIDKCLNHISPSKKDLPAI